MSPVALLALLAVAEPGQAASQTTPAKPATPAPANAVSGVTVVAGKQAVQTSIDRRSYDITRDLQATSGSVADALRNVPTVEVSPQGDVSMRGANVTILVDGKVSGVFKGANAGLALQSLPANQIERVEVITNPSAEFSPEGAGGVINLITKKTRQPGLSGAARLNLAKDHENGGLNLNYRAGKLTLNAALSVRHDAQRTTSAGQEQFFSPAGALQTSTRDVSASLARSDSLNYSVSGDYDLDANTKLSGGFYHGQAEGGGKGSVDRVVTPADGSLLQHSVRLTDQKYGFGYDDIDFTLRRQLPGDSRHQLTLSLDYDIVSSPNRRSVSEVALPSSTPLSFFDTPMRSRSALTQLDLKYDRPMPGKSMLKLGYSLRQYDTRSSSGGVAGLTAALAIPDLNQTDTFDYGETVHALYVTYERPLGKKLTVLPGLRLEAVSHDLRDVTSGLRATGSEVSLYPSLHLDYALTDTQSLNFSYSHRISRPSPQDLNPFRQILDPTHLRQGNPALQPQDTDSFEAGWQRRKDGALLLATLFRRDTTGGIADSVTELPGNVLLTTRANIGTSHATGVDLSASGKPFKTLSYNISGSAYYSELFTPGLSLGSSGKASSVVARGKANLTWQATPKDIFQADVQINGKQVTPQGYTAPTGQLNLGYRHKFDDAWAFNVTATDAANSARYRYVLDTPQLRRRSTAQLNSRAVLLGFTYTFGQGPPRTAAFDFGGGGGAPTP